MAQRPIFISTEIKNENKYFDAEIIDFKWHPGYSVSQKRKSINSLHENFLQMFPEKKILEISTKSENQIGIELSAFNLKIHHSKYGMMPIECAYQGGKIFRDKGQLKDLYSLNPYKIKKDLRLRNGGKIIGFEFDGEEFDINPNGLFYNWIYIKALNQNLRLRNELIKYDAFSDIEYNPAKSLNCQAKACALFVSLYKSDMIDLATNDISTFISIQKNVQKEDKIGSFESQTELNL